MRLDFDWSDDGRAHQYCFQCRVEAVGRVRVGGRTFYDCASCGHRSDRSVVIDPAVRWWTDSSGEYWHESAGVFAGDGTGRFLFFERTLFPFVLTVPAGHVDAGEDPAAAARRELAEETDLRPGTVDVLGVHDLVGDSCRRGSDAHRWHAYLTVVRPPAGTVRLGDEGRRPVWLTPADARRRELAFPVRFVLSHYERILTGAG